jgi:hypothetical protein
MDFGRGLGEAIVALFFIVAALVILVVGMGAYIIAGWTASWISALIVTAFIALLAVKLK